MAVDAETLAAIRSHYFPGRPGMGGQVEQALGEQSNALAYSGDDAGAVKVLTACGWPPPA